MEKKNCFHVTNIYKNYIFDLELFLKRGKKTEFIEVMETSCFEEDLEELKKIFGDEKISEEGFFLDTPLLKEQQFIIPLEVAMEEASEESKDFFDNSISRGKAYVQLHKNIEEVFRKYDIIGSELNYVGAGETVKLSEILESEISVAICGGDIIDDLYDFKKKKVLKESFSKRIFQEGKY